ncbi:hypothetical protein NDJ78_21730 [Vibrio parahaemolyticus]|uniref:hypothetical protein n=1 Tax=Vibrio parahaemolyticus TaxID=670 RepID=UPI00215ECD32|nr:hypothetical protein [Vibrio parahaemolyticus]MCS0192788.1 hypothetical protein [Vibrio parahaemolyticus]
MTIEKKLEEALYESCSDAFYFSDDETSLIEAEYLLTVNAAKKVRELNVCFGDPYKIFLEHSTESFSTNCVPLISKVPTKTRFPKSVSRKGTFNTTRDGKIDIAVYKNTGYLSVPHCAIEVKGFNPLKPKVIEDLERNIEYFSFKGNTGQSLLDKALFIALHSYKKTMTDPKEQANLDKVEKKYKGYLSSLKFPAHVQYKIKVFTVRRGLVPDPQDPYVQEFGLDGTEDYHFVGAIITFEKINLTNNLRVIPNALHSQFKVGLRGYGGII